jgi:hypothetical protein
MIGTVRRKPAAPSRQVVHVTPQRFLDSASKRFLRGRPVACSKCGSTYIRHEPAFVHCRLCGKIARVADAPLGEQELYELRSGLRLAC